MGAVWVVGVAEEVFFLSLPSNSPHLPTGSLTFDLPPRKTPTTTYDLRSSATDAVMCPESQRLLFACIPLPITRHQHPLQCLRSVLIPAHDVGVHPRRDSRVGVPQATAHIRKGDVLREQK